MQKYDLQVERVQGVIELLHVSQPRVIRRSMFDFKAIVNSYVQVRP